MNLLTAIENESSLSFLSSFGKNVTIPRHARLLFDSSPRRAAFL